MVRRKKEEPQLEKVSIKLEEFLDSCRLRGLATRTVDQYEESVKWFISICGDLEEVGQSDVLRFTKSLEPLSPGRANFFLRGLRTFLNYCNLGIKVNLVKEKKKTIVPFTDEQIEKTFAQIDRKSFVGIRDYALFQLLYDTGMRISEATGLCKKDIFNGYVHVKGKGNKERIVPIGDFCQKKLKEYLKQVEDIPEDKPIFVTQNDLPIDRKIAHYRLNYYADKARITGVRVSPHTFRHTFARNFLIAGGNILALQKILGHESLDMVKLYTYLFSQDIINEHHKFSPSDRLFSPKKRRK